MKNSFTVVFVIGVLLTAIPALAQHSHVDVCEQYGRVVCVGQEFDPYVPSIYWQVQREDCRTPQTVGLIKNLSVPKSQPFPALWIIQSELGEGALTELIDRREPDHRVYVFTEDLSTPQCSNSKEWKFGSAVQVTYKADNDTDHRWNAQLGVCDGTNVTFSNKRYFSHEPIVAELSAIYGELYTHPWVSDEVKGRTYYVFESDHRAFRARIAGVMNAILGQLLLSDEVQPEQPPVYSPDNPQPDLDENDIILDQDSWQNVYPDGATYCQAELRGLNLVKVKFGLKQADRVVIFHALTLPTTVVNDWNDWTRGGPPIDLAENFLEYMFTNEHDPGDNTDVWTARVWIPGYNQ
jgi:hypothetical protein